MYCLFIDVKNYGLLHLWPVLFDVYVKILKRRGFTVPVFYICFRNREYKNSVRDTLKL
jgi:hypothetical protein